MPDSIDKLKTTRCSIGKTEVLSTGLPTSYNVKTESTTNPSRPVPKKPTHHYFHRATEAKQALLDTPSALPRKRPNHKGKVVLVELEAGEFLAMSSREAAMQVGRSRGGAASAAKRSIHLFTTTSATAAVTKLWETRWRKVHGIRIGRPLTKKSRTEDRLHIVPRGRIIAIQRKPKKETE